MGFFKKAAGGLGDFFKGKTLSDISGQKVVAQPVPFAPAFGSLGTAITKSGKAISGVGKFVNPIAKSILKPTLVGKTPLGTAAKTFRAFSLGGLAAGVIKESKKVRKFITTKLTTLPTKAGEELGTFIENPPIPEVPTTKDLPGIISTGVRTAGIAGAVAGLGLAATQIPNIVERFTKEKTTERIIQASPLSQAPKAVSDRTQAQQPTFGAMAAPEKLSEAATAPKAMPTINNVVQVQNFINK